MARRGVSEGDGGDMVLRSGRVLRERGMNFGSEGRVRTLAHTNDEATDENYVGHGNLFGHDQSVHQEERLSLNRTRRENPANSEFSVHRPSQHRNEDHRPEDGNIEDQRQRNMSEVGRTRDDQSAGHGVRQTMRMFRDAMVEAIQHRPQGMPPPHPGTPMLPIVTAMKNLKTPYFEGSHDPIEADQWFRKLEKNLETAMCPENLKKRIGVYYLDKDATEWWESCERHLGRSASWATFKSEFERKYFTAEARLRLQRQFLNLKQGEKTIREYESEFMRLRRHALPGQDDDKAMITNFMFGVRSEFESRLAVGTYNSLTELIEKAVNVENGLNAERDARRSFTQNQGGKNASNTGNFRNKGKEKESGEERGKSRLSKFTGQCYYCGKMGHKSSECRSRKQDRSQQGSNEVICYSCGQKGHYANNCSAKRPIPTTPLATRPPQAPPAIEPAPKRQALGGRVYALELDDPKPPGPAQGPIAGNWAL